MMNAIIRLKGMKLSQEKKKALLAEIHEQLDIHQFNHERLTLNLRIKKGKMTVKMLLKDKIGSYHSKVTQSSLALAIEICHDNIEKMQLKASKRIQTMRTRNIRQKRAMAVSRSQVSLASVEKLSDSKKIQKITSIKKKSTPQKDQVVDLKKAS
jgi:hypothetical protein